MYVCVCVWGKSICTSISCPRGYHHRCLQLSFHLTVDPAEAEPSSWREIVAGMKRTKPRGPGSTNINLNIENWNITMLLLIING